jgi:hypothetical protein
LLGVTVFFFVYPICLVFVSGCFWGWSISLIKFRKNKKELEKK